MTDDSTHGNRRSPFQFSLWQLTWLVCLCSVISASIEGLGADGAWLAGAALLGAVLGQAIGGSMQRGTLRGFGAVGGGAIGGLVAMAPWEGPLGFLIGLVIGACWLLVSTRIHPSARRAGTTGTSARKKEPFVERVAETRRGLLRAALLVAIAGLGISVLVGFIVFLTSHPLDRWFYAVRVFSLSGAVSLLVAATLAGVSSVLALGSRRPKGHDDQEAEDEDNRPMIVTIDGPAGAGKSTVARRLALRLGFRFLDTGAMYRAVTLAAIQRGLDLDRTEELARLARGLKIELVEDRVLLDGEDVTEAVRRSEVTAASRHAADNPQVREHLVRLQRAAAGGQDVVTEGRDQGSVAFPEAECKIFLTASPDERARRRLGDLEAQGEAKPLDEVRDDLTRRDQQDAARPVGPLVRPADAVEVNTDGLSVSQVVDRLEAIVRERRES